MVVRSLTPSCIFKLIIERMNTIHLSIISYYLLPELLDAEMDDRMYHPFQLQVIPDRGRTRLMPVHCHIRNNSMENNIILTHNTERVTLLLKDNRNEIIQCPKYPYQASISVKN